jgi:PTS system mannose-specific IIA component
VIGIVIVAHGRLGLELKDAIESIVGTLERFAAVEVPPEAPLTGIRPLIERAIESVDDGDGVLVLTDLFGGTSTNVSLSFLREDRVDVLSGVNLPMLMKVSTARQGRTLRDLGALLRDYGKRHIQLASDVLGARDPVLGDAS